MGAALSAEIDTREQSKHQLQRELADAVRNTVAMQNGEAPRRTLENGERNLVSQSERWAAPAERVARAMISSPPNGSGTIPCDARRSIAWNSTPSRREGSWFARVEAIGGRCFSIPLCLKV